MGTRQKTYDHQMVTIFDSEEKKASEPKGDYLNVWNVLWNVFVILFDSFLKKNDTACIKFCSKSSEFKLDFGEKL